MSYEDLFLTCEQANCGWAPCSGGMAACDADAYFKDVYAGLML